MSVPIDSFGTVSDHWDRDQPLGPAPEKPPADAATAGVPAARSRTAQQRERRVEDGVAELDRWLRDQVTRGLAQSENAPYQLWDDAARRLIDSQAPALAGQVRALASRVREPDWPRRLLEEYALLRLLATAYRRRDQLPAPLRATVRARIGFTVGRQEVLDGTTGDGDGPPNRVRDQWYVAGSRDTEQEHLITRRIWLRGRHTGRPAVVLSFAGPGRALDTSLAVGTTVDAELAFYPGAQPLRALVAERYGPHTMAAPGGTTARGLLREYAAALGRDPWLDRWPAMLANVRVARGGGRRWHLVDGEGAALPLRGGDPWRLLALSGGRPVTVAAEWTPHGLWPLSAWHDEEGAVTL